MFINVYQRKTSGARTVIVKKYQKIVTNRIKLQQNIKMTLNILKTF